MKPKNKVFDHFMSVNENDRIKYVCTFCGVVYECKNVTRFAKHLVSNCKTAPVEVKNLFKSGENADVSNSSSSFQTNETDNNEATVTEVVALAMLQRVNVQVDGAGGRKMGHGEVGSGAPVPLTVERGLVLAPGVLQRLLPDVAIVVKGAMQSAGCDIKTEQPLTSNPQLLPSVKKDDRPSAFEQKPSQHKPKQEKVKQPNLESRQRWNMFPCNICTLRFPSRPTLNKHRLNHKAFKNMGIGSKERRIKAKKQYMCKFCPQIFPLDELRQLHMKIHVENKNASRKNQETLVFCNDCETYFSNSFELRAHKKRKTCFLKDVLVPRKDHSCHVCSKEFEDTFDLTLHLRIHGAPVKSYSVRKPKSNTVGAKPHTDTELSDSISALIPKSADSGNATKGQDNRDLKESCSDSNLKPPGSVNDTKIHKDRNVSDSVSAQNPKPSSVNAAETHKDTQSGGSHTVCNQKYIGLVNATKVHKYIELGECFSSRNPIPTGLIIVNDSKAHKDLGASDSAQKPKFTDSIYATKTHKITSEDSFHTCNKIAKTYTRLKLPKLTETVNCPTANNKTTKSNKVAVKEVSRNSLNEKAANFQITNISEGQCQEKSEFTNVICYDSNKNITPFRYNFRDNMFAINSVTIKEAFREKSDEGVDTDSNGAYEEPEIKEGIVLRPEFLEQLGIDLNEVSAVNNNNEYVLPDTSNLYRQDTTSYDTGIHCEVNKRNTIAVKAEEPEGVFREKIREHGNDVWSNAIVKEEPQELDDKSRMMKSIEYDNESMIKTELLSLCKDEVEDESVLGLPLHESHDIALEVSHKGTAAETEQNKIVKEESAEFTKNISKESKDLVNAVLEAAWKELYAEHEAMELALLKIEKDPEITNTMDFNTDLVNKQDTVRVKVEVEVLEDTNITDVFDFTIIENKTDTVNFKEESEVLGYVSGGNDEKFNDIADENKNHQGIKLDKVDLEFEQAGLYVDHQIEGEIVLGPVRLHRPDFMIVPKEKQTELTDTVVNLTDSDVRSDLVNVKKKTKEIKFNKDEKNELKGRGVSV